MSPQFSRALALIGAFTVILATVTRGQSQTAPADNAALNKKACDFVTKAEAESILGVAVEPRTQNAYQCAFAGVGFTNRPPNNKQVSVKVSFWTSPQPKAFADVKQGLAQFANRGTATDIANFADAALWFWAPGSGGTLYAYRSGTVGVEITVAGLAEDVALRQAKALASKPLGGTTPTGYAYLGTVKGDANAAATASAAAAADAAATARLIAQGTTYSQAPYVTDAQFTKSVKEVALEIHTEPEIGKYISEAEQRRAIETEFARYGIAVRPTAPIRLVATVSHEGFVMTKGGDKFPIHDLVFLATFKVKGWTWRDGTFHFVEAEPVYREVAIDAIEKSEFQKLVLGDDNLKRVRDAFLIIVAQAFKSIADGTSPESRPWPAAAWTPQQKAAADAQAARLAGAPPTVTEKRLVGMAAAPQLFLTPETNSDECAPHMAAWNDLWKRSFQRMGFATGREDPAFGLEHVFSCFFNNGITYTHYYRIYDRIDLWDRAFAFQLNGSWVHIPATLLHSYRTNRVLDITPVSQDYLPRSITDFLLDIAGNR